jgi:hypothetical protein
VPFRVVSWTDSLAKLGIHKSHEKSRRVKLLSFIRVTAILLVRLRLFQQRAGAQAGAVEDDRLKLRYNLGPKTTIAIACRVAARCVSMCSVYKSKTDQSNSDEIS